MSFNSSLKISAMLLGLDRLKNKRQILVKRQFEASWISQQQ